jgi:hypothetical protein
MREGKAVIALIRMVFGPVSVISKHGAMANTVANSGLIVAPAFRKGGLARANQKKIFELSRQTYPDSKSIWFVPQVWPL